MTTVTQLVGAMNTDRVTVGDIELRGNISNQSPTSFRINYVAGDYDIFTGSGFTFNAAGKPIGGSITGIAFAQGNVTRLTLTDIATLTVPQMLALVDSKDSAGYLRQLTSGNDTITGSAQADTIRVQAGDDTITGGGGNDVIDGGAGTDTAVYAGASTQYTVTASSDGSVRVVDNRAGSPDGSDTLLSVERLRFSDTTINAPTLAGGASKAVTTAYANILQGSATSSAAVDLAAKVAAGTLTEAQAISQVIAAAASTTSVATLSYQFFTGAVPTAGGYEYLVSSAGPNPNNLNSAYYQSFNLENRYINFAVNLGKTGEGKANFAEAYGSLSLFDATKKAYATVFGGTPTDAKVAALLSGGRDAYFAAYGGDGTNGVGAKAAMVGWLLAEAVKADVGMYAKANDAYLADLADGAITNVPLIGVYGSPDFVVSG